MLKRILFSCCILLVCATAVAGRMYKWRDADGKVHFTQTRPPSTAIPAEKMETNGNQNSVESNWSAGMKSNARDFMNNAGVRRVWVDRKGNEVESRNRY
jgi:hypothetical protein